MLKAEVIDQKPWFKKDFQFGYSKAEHNLKTSELFKMLPSLTGSENPFSWQKRFMTEVGFQSLLECKALK